MVTLTISSVSKPPPFARGLPITIDCDEDLTVADVKALITTKFPKFYAARQKLSRKGERGSLNDEQKVAEVVGKQGGEFQVKDLGPQLSWRTVFLIEYGGPLVIHPLFYHLPRVWYGQDVQHSALQKFVYVMVMVHFMKRELETLFVHRFSHGTMPFNYVFRNSAHYHLLSGLALAYDVYRPKYSATSPYVAGTIRDNKTFLWICTGIWAFAELSNLRTHLTLRALRPPGTRVRAVPYGYGFTMISCPNYFFESVGWAVIWAMTGSVAAGVFTVIATSIMGVWALQKHKKYKKEFGKEYPRGRYAMIPYIL
ncbi:3-oxo-5-alpha-steroid 4-dehydrogenase-domain-containing protein [Lyophyllum atratum]|nr:3-oxo-5-alpha-steroid 4-dehydrogenase-domain-containing protein [Lyophyllum atratum]